MKFLLLLFLFLIAYTPARACRYIPQDFETLYNQADVVFIGVVQSLKESEVVFNIEKGYKNASAGNVFTVQPGSSSCHVRFSPGQKWLYLGDTVMTGSRILQYENGMENPENIAFVDSFFAHRDDSLVGQIDLDVFAGWPPKGRWRACDADQDCRLMYIGCNSLLAVSQDHYKAAEDYYYNKRGLDPRAMDCAVSAPGEQSEKYAGEIMLKCVQGKCGAWQHETCLNPPACTQIYRNHCTVELKSYMDPENEDSYGSGLRILFAMSETQCADKCRKEFEAQQGWARQYYIPKVGAQCLFNDILLFDETVLIAPHETEN
ncbi:MAG TPA: hypothetical protein PK513_00880 [Alphaproteobacteria bacterium]|nr:hypothetical protein [Alphaproteobacteria bacterium]USO05884.1 MAG: hypothetical protein H6859_01390 [Rhodospirillales bacterium]HOO81043.1 hypothetical protein [Alphaproteobacteria bacterium]